MLGKSSIYHRTSEGARNSLSNRASNGISNALNPVRGVRDAMRRKGIEPKNHHKANLEKMRRTAKMKREKKELEEERQNLPKRKFKNVKSKFLSEANQAAAKAGIKHSFLKKPPRSNSLKISRKSNETKQESRLTKPAVPRQATLRRSSSCPAVKRESKDWLSLNKQKVWETESRLKSKEKVDFLAKKDYGKIPSYITQRKIEWAEKREQQRIEAERTKIPPGMKLMDEDERVLTLEALTDNARKLEDALGKMSITSDTLKSRQRDADLREKLNEVEAALKIFSKKHVFIHE